MGVLNLFVFLQMLIHTEIKTTMVAYKEHQWCFLGANHLWQTFDPESVCKIKRTNDHRYLILRSVENKILLLDFIRMAQIEPSTGIQQPIRWTVPGTMGEGLTKPVECPQIARNEYGSKTAVDPFEMIMIFHKIWTFVRIMKWIPIRDRDIKYTGADLWMTVTFSDENGMLTYVSIPLNQLTESADEWKQTKSTPLPKYTIPTGGNAQEYGSAVALPQYCLLNILGGFLQWSDSSQGYEMTLPEFDVHSMCMKITSQTIPFYKAQFHTYLPLHVSFATQSK